MAHKEWCGFPCSDCTTSCRLDESIPCSPDCENLKPDGSRKVEKCKASGCDAYPDKNSQKSNNSHDAYVKREAIKEFANTIVEKLEERIAYHSGLAHYEKQVGTYHEMREHEKAIETLKLTIELIKSETD